jgi:membrane-bound serine protease (ClpP class)
MVAVGVALVLVGAAFLVAEAHAPYGILGTIGAVSLVGGAVLAIAAAGAGLAVILAVALAGAAIAGLWLTVAARKVLATRALRARSGSEALNGQLGVVRSWNGREGQVLVQGALWRARRSWPDDDCVPAPGDSVVVENMSGLTLGVRKAEEWEEPC